jgi:hypothetical protein
MARTSYFQRDDDEVDAVKTMVTKWVFIIHNSKKNRHTRANKKVQKEKDKEK